ncbi:MAG: hypothetical protein AAGG56_12150 [Pseudomonadota bacterium]
MSDAMRMLWGGLTSHGGLDMQEWRDDLPMPQPGPQEVVAAQSAFQTEGRISQMLGGGGGGLGLGA